MRPAESGNLQDFVNVNPHVHVLAGDGAFPPDGRFVTLPAAPGSLLAEGFRHAVLEFLVDSDARSEGHRSRMLGSRCGATTFPIGTTEGIPCGTST